MRMEDEMKAITLRHVPEPLASRIEERAKRTGFSLSRTVIEMLSEQTGVAKARIHHDLDHLIGTMSAEDVAERDAEIAAQRSIGLPPTPA
jgi:hypothetical protein